jgi:cytochrome c-type biogenesis protein CcmH/NrfF
MHVLMMTLLIWLVPAVLVRLMLALISAVFPSEPPCSPFEESAQKEHSTLLGTLGENTPRAET